MDKDLFADLSAFVLERSTPSAVKTVDGEAVKSPAVMVDADTQKVGTQSYRTEGFNAPETAKQQGGIFIPNQVYGDRSQENTNKVAQLMEATNLVDTGERNRNRIVARQENPAVKNSLGDMLIAAGLQDPNRFTSDVALRERAAINAFSKLMPSLAEADPILRLANEEEQKRIKENAGVPLYVAKENATDEAQYAAIKGMVGIKAANEQREEIDRLKEILKDPGLSKETRADLENKVIAAQEKLFFAATTPDFIGGVNVRRDDRNIMNQARDQLSTAWDRAVINTKKQFYGWGEQLGDAQQWKWLAEKSKAEVIGLKVRDGLQPDILNSLSQIRTDDNSWDTIKDTATFLTNTAAGSLPMIGIMVGGSMAAGAIGIAGATGVALGALPAALLYSGGFYADQPDDKKNSGLALTAGITSAILEKVGLSGIRGGNLFSKIGREEALAEMITLPKYLGNRAAAEEALKTASKQTIMELAKGTAEFAEKHYATKLARMQALAGVGMATAKEGGTEGLQTIVEMMAASGEIDFDQRYEKGFNQAVVDAMVGGAAMGGALKLADTALEMTQWHSLADAKRQSTKALTDAMEFQMQQRTLKQAGLADGDPRGVTSVLDAVAKVRAYSTDDMAANPIKGLFELEGDPGNWRGFRAAISDPLRLYRALSNTTVKDLRKEDGTLKFWSPILLSLMKGGILAGDHLDGARQKVIGQWTTPTAEVLATNLKTSVRSANDMLRNAWQTTWSQGGRLEGNTAQELELQNWFDEVNMVNSDIKTMLGDLGYNSGQLGDLNTVFEEAAIDTAKVEKNREKIIATMMRNSSSRHDAETAINNIISGNPTLAVPAKQWMSDHGVFADNTLNNLFEPNIFSAFENYKHKVASQATKELYIGKNGEVLAKLLQLAKRDGEFKSESEYRDTVQNVQDWFQIVNGNYNTLKNYPTIEKILNWGVTMMMLASLGKAAFSSIPEVALSTLGTPGDKVMTQIGIAAKELGKELKSDMNAAMSYTTSSLHASWARNHPNASIRKQIDDVIEARDMVYAMPGVTQAAKDKADEAVQAIYRKHMGRNLHERLGFNDSGYNSQTKFETDSANGKRVMQFFASLIGLRAMTDATRIGTTAMAADIFRVRLLSLQAIPREDRNRRFSTGDDLTNEQYQSLKELMQYGLDVEATLDALDNLGMDVDSGINQIASGRNRYMGKESDHDILKQNLETAIRNMVDSKIVNPQSANLPKYYHDPRLRVFTAMTRFVAGLTANILPRLYRDYMVNGSVGMRYQSFAAIGLAIAFAHMANILKDVLSYGDDENPYLKSNVKKAQRDIYGSGILGRGEGLVDAAAPLYGFGGPDLYNQPIAYGWNALKNQAPPLNWGDRVVKSVYNVSKGNTEQGVKQAVRSAPLVGSFPQAANYAAEFVKKE